MNNKKIASILAKRPKTVLLVFSLITILIGVQATNIYMVSDFTEYLPNDDPSIELWNRISEEFEIGPTIIILIDQSDRLYDIRNPKVLTEMDEVIQMIDTYQDDRDGIYAVNSLSSLIKKENAKPVLNGGNGVNSIPSDIEDVYTYMEKIIINTMKGVLYTDSYKFTVIVLQLSENADFDDVLKRTENAIDARGTTYANMTITGSIAYKQAIQEQSMRNLVIIFPIALIFVSIVLFFFHRTIKGIIIAFLPPAFAIILTFGILGIVMPELTIISVALVALLLGLGVDYSIHLMNRYTEENNIKDLEKRVEKILSHTGKAVLLSTITTMIGFASLMISSMSPIVTFGFGCAIGIFFCFISAIILVPCMVIILKFEKKSSVSSWKKLARFTINNGKRVVIFAVFLAIMSIIVLPNVKTDANYMDMAPEGIPEVEAMYKYSENFGSGSSFNAVLIETVDNGLLDEDFITAISKMQDEMRDAISEVYPDIDGSIIENSVYSVADEINEIAGLINRSVILAKLEEYVDAEKIIFDMIAEEGVVDKDFSKTLVSISIPIGYGTDKLEAVINKLNEIADNTVLPNNGEVSHVAGQDAITISVNKKLTDEQVRSMILALIMVLAALILIFNSSAYGFLTIIPIILVLSWEPGFLVAFDIPLSLATISIAAIMVGVGIDYGVHITHRFREEISEGKSKEEAIKISIEKTGISLVEAALTTIAGIAAIFFVNTPVLNEFVIVVVLMTALSCIAAALIMPVFFKSKHIK